MKVYTNIHTREKVDEDEAFDYVMDKLGVVECKESGLMEDFKENFGQELVDWYFSGNFIEEDIPLERIISGCY